VILRFYDSSLRSEFILYILCRVKKVFLTTLVKTTMYGSSKYTKVFNNHCCCLLKLDLKSPGLVPQQGRLWGSSRLEAARKIQIEIRSQICHGESPGSCPGCLGHGSTGFGRVIAPAGLLTNPDRSSHQVDQPGRFGFNNYDYDS
jgi:hypothetical protein